MAPKVCFMKSINFAPSDTQMKGTTARMPATSFVASVCVDTFIVGLRRNSVSRSRLSFVLNPSSGKSRNLTAISIKAESVGPPAALPSAEVLEPESIASIAWSSCSMSGRSAMRVLHLSAQVLDCAELKLLNGTLAAPEFDGNLANALLFHEAHVNHSELGFRQPGHQLEQHGGVFDFSVNGGFRLRGKIARLAAEALPVVGHDTRGDPHEP